MNSPEPSPLAAILAAAKFAAEKHRSQKRKNTDQDPYIIHPITVAELLARVASVTDVAILQAALLHDTIEDTQTTPAELDARFGPHVRQLVQEVTDDKTLPQAERKRLQVEHAPGLSPGARLIKLADKISNLSDLTHSEPKDWSLKRKLEYIDWAEQVVSNIRDPAPALAALFAQTVREKRTLLGAAPTKS